MLERDYQSRLIKEIKRLLPGCYVLKTDPNYIQGFPDLLILYKRKWAALEVKTSATAKQQANQEFYIDDLNSMAFASFIFPEIEEEVLDDLQSALKPTRRTRLPRAV